MTKRLLGLALLGASALSVALPATPAYACWTFPRECAERVVDSATECRLVGTFVICPAPVDA